MIYTVTFNPSLDYIVRLADFVPGAVNRTCGEQILCGGKGINVSVVLRNLGVDNVALGFIAGFTGKEIARQLSALGCRSDFIELPTGLSRVNVKIKAAEESEINGRGPAIGPAALDSLFLQLERLAAGDTLVLAGSIPSALPSDIYERILARLDGRGVRAVVDATCDLLRNVLKYRPFLIKPNKAELAELFSAAIENDADVVRYARELQSLGAQNVLVSLAGDGALLLTADGAAHRGRAPRGKVVNSVGAGDSMVAGFLAGLLQGGGLQDALRWGLAAGSASAFSEQLARREEVEALLPHVQL